MFQKSIFTRTKINCPDHPQNCVTHMCKQLSCTQSSLLCNQCLKACKQNNSHYGHQSQLLPLESSLRELSQHIGRQKGPMNNLYRKMLSGRASEGLLMWQEQKQQHLNSVNRNIESLKVQIDEQMQNIEREFMKWLHKGKERLYSQLQDYYTQYKKHFQSFNLMTDPMMAMQNRFKHFTSGQSILFKFATENNSMKLKKWIADLKYSLIHVETAILNPGSYLEQVVKAEQNANLLMDCLPNLRRHQYELELPTLLQKSVEEILNSLVRMKRVQPVSLLQRSNSSNVLPQPRWE